MGGGGAAHGTQLQIGAQAHQTTFGPLPFAASDVRAALDTGTAKFWDAAASAHPGDKKKHTKGQPHWDSNAPAIELSVGDKAQIDTQFLSHQYSSLGPKLAMLA